MKTEPTFSSGDIVDISPPFTFTQFTQCGKLYLTVTTDTSKAFRGGDGKLWCERIVDVYSDPERTKLENTLRYHASINEEHPTNREHFKYICPGVK